MTANACLWLLSAAKKITRCPTPISPPQDTIDARLKSAHPGEGWSPRRSASTFLRKNSAESDEPLQPHTRDHDLQNMNGTPLIDHVHITGPFDATGPGRYAQPSPHFFLPSGQCGRRTPCAKKILSTLARRAYRQPVTDADVEILLSFYQNPDERTRTSTPESRTRCGFILTESEVPVPRPNPIRQTWPPDRSIKSAIWNSLRDLSFFLWSSVPDDELLNVASQGKLKDPAVLEQQVKRMLADPEIASAGQELRRPVAVPAQPAEREAGRSTSFRISTTTCGRPSAAKPNCSSRAFCAKIAASWIC